VVLTLTLQNLAAKVSRADETHGVRR